MSDEYSERIDPYTPVTVFDRNGQQYEANLIDASIARQLQRELAEALILAEARREAMSRMHDEMENQAARANRNADERDEAVDAANTLTLKLAAYKAALELIRDHGGCTTTDEGLTCTGSWCGEQARRALEES